jgi:precorrin-4 methylase
LVIEIEVTNENLLSKNAQYRHVLTILQKQSSISQIVEMPKLTRIQKSFKVNLLSHVSWPMTLVITITIEEIVHHRSLQVFDEKMEL